MYCRNRVAKRDRLTIYDSSLTSFSRRQSGAVAVLVGGILMVLIFFAAFAIDIGYAMVTKNELQNTADAAALAGARMLGRIYECNADLVNCPAPMPYETQKTYVADATTIKTAAKDVALENSAGGQYGIAINDADIVIGNWDAVNKKVDPVTLISPDAVQVIARRDGSANGPIHTFIASIMGIDAVNVSAIATAALTGSGSMAEGGLNFPAAINKSWMDSSPCNKDLTFNPSSAGVCAAWHTYDLWPPSAHQQKEVLTDLTNGTPISPETIAWVTQYMVNNGGMATLLAQSYMQDLFDAMRIRNDGKLDFDEDDATWTTAVPIFDDDPDGTGVLCNPNGATTIVGFATIVITGVLPPSLSTISATITCDIVEPGRGGGGSYGTKGSIPGLVK